ncbi:MAG: SET domain-containing protein-lysine N-methyltransferase [Patescibacteria group bacterium]|nr:SET domain-containing protein-lysine N-methyltransferase [Patescibacteria group bacterium]
MFISDKICISKSNKERSLFAKKEINKGETILEFEKNFLKSPTKTSMQIGKRLHQESPDHKSVENFINHSCESNCYINFDGLVLKTSRKILRGEELTFNYNTTEFELKSPFKCECGSKKCANKIRGFNFLNLKQKKEIKEFISPFFEEEVKIIKASII